MTAPLAAELPISDDEIRRLRASHALERAQLLFKIGQLERALAESGPVDVTETTESLVKGFAPATDFADVWGGEDSSHEERDAAETFFQNGGLDERARRWFLRDL